MQLEPILLDFPEKLIGERIYLRSSLPGDGVSVHQAINASLIELKLWMPWAHQENTMDVCEQNCRQAYAKFIMREDLRWHIFRKENDQFLGAIGLHRIDWQVRKFEIGYWIDTRHHKQGYMTEAATLLVTFSFTFLKANRLEIRCDSRNLASIRTANKLGFTFEGILRNDNADFANNIIDTHVFSMIGQSI